MDLAIEPRLDQQEKEELEANVDWQRNEDYAFLCKTLDLLAGDLSEEEIRLLEYFGKDFLEKFPSWKQDQEKISAKLRAIADEIDTGHKRATKINVAANSAAVASGLMNILGLALAPMTAGGSLAISAIGQTLGAAAGVTSVVTSWLERSRNKKAQEQAFRLLPTNQDHVPPGKETSKVTTAGEVILKLGNVIDTIRNSKGAYKVAEVNPHLVASAKRVLTGGTVSSRSARNVRNAFAGTPLAMTKEMIRNNGVLAALFLSQDVYALWKEGKHLFQEGAKDELAEELREQAKELEEVLAKATRLYQKLKQKKLSKNKKTRKFTSGGSRGDSTQGWDGGSPQRQKPGVPSAIPSPGKATRRRPARMTRQTPGGTRRDPSST